MVDISGANRSAPSAGEHTMLAEKNSTSVSDGQQHIASSSQWSLIKYARWQHLAAGVCGGVISTLMLHPLDLIKIRFQGKIDLIYSYI
jgi:Mitochondrial carrier protein